jgi:cytochrome b involved in lipid metabolism
MFLNEEEVLKYYKKDPDNNKVVIYGGIVYDVKEYMGGHPGGSQLIEPYLGQNIEEPFED